MDWLEYLQRQAAELADWHLEHRWEPEWASPAATLARQEAVLARLRALHRSRAIHLERRN